MGGEPAATPSLVTSAVATTLLGFLSLTSWMLRQEKIVFGLV